MLTTAYYGLLRASEFLKTDTNHTLNYRDVKVINTKGNKFILLQFTTYKHSKDACKLKIQQANSKWCPVRILSDYLEKRGKKPGPLFVDQHGKAIKRTKFSLFLKQCISFSGGNATKYNIHSLRVGRATQLLMENCSDSSIRSAGRWHSDAFKQYLRPTTITLPK